MPCSAWWPLFAIEIKVFQCSRGKSVPPSQIVWRVFKSFFTRRQTDWILTYHIIIVYVIGWQRPHFDSVRIQSWFLCWNQNVCKILFEQLVRWDETKCYCCRCWQMTKEQKARCPLSRLMWTKICKKTRYIGPPGLGVFFPNDSLIWLDDPTSKLGLEADKRTLERVLPW